MIPRALLLSLMVASGAFAQSTPAPAPSKYPTIKVQVAVGTQQRRLGDSYRKSMDIQPKIVIEGSSRMVPLPAAEATMLVITMDTRAKYTSNMEVYKVHAAETVSVPAAPTGERRPFAFADSTVTFDSYRDKSNIGGDVYKYYVFGLRDLATKAIVDFQTNHSTFATYSKAHPEKREEILNLKTGAKFPSAFK